MTPSRPRLEEATFKGLELVPPEVREVLQSGIPRVFLRGRFAASEEVSMVDVPSRGRLYRFGSSGFGVSICLDPTTGQIIQVVDCPADGGHLVNTSLDRFIMTMRRVNERFPYYGYDSSDEDLQAATNDLSQIIIDVDAIAISTDTFWATFIDDVLNGDFATEDIVTQ